MLQLNEYVNSMILEPTTEYFIITGGAKGMIRKISIITGEMKEIQNLGWKTKRLTILGLSFVAKNKILISMSDSSLKCMECEEYKEPGSLYY